MTKADAKQRIAKLRTEIHYHRRLVHVEDRQEISEAALDALKHELKQLEDQFPDLVTPDSPTQRVAGQPLAAFKKVSHATPMLSLEDAFSFEEVRDWANRLTKLLHHEPADYFVEVKVDGISLSLVYEQGKLVTAATRGNGRIGEDVTQNAKTIEAIPLSVPLEELPATMRAAAAKRLEVRGEVYMNRTQFDRLNATTKRTDGQAFANPRNATAGAVRQLDSSITAARKLSFMVWDVVTDLGQGSHQASHELAARLGFPTNRLDAHCTTLAEVEKFLKRLEAKRDKLPYWFDGAVINVNSIADFKKLGVVGKTPRGATAFKFPAEQTTTIVEDIVVQVGRTGALTPVAHLKPVQVAGTTVARATLHNADEIQRLDVRIGDTVIIEKAGDIIPDVIQVLPTLRPNNARVFHLPSTCPVCGKPVSKDKDGVILYCRNQQCPARHREQLYYFVSKNGFDMDGVGPSVIDLLIEEGLVHTAADIFRIKPTQLVGLPLFAETKANKVVAAIQAAKTIPLPRFLVALGIRHVGEETAIDIAQRFGTLAAVRQATEEQIHAVPNVGGVVAKSVAGYFADRRNQQLIDQLLKAGVNVTAALRAVRHTLEGKSFVVTGTLETLTRDQAHAKIRAAGGDVSSSVSKKTSYVVAGAEPGSKLEKAQALGVSVLSETQFLKLLE